MVCTGGAAQFSPAKLAVPESFTTVPSDHVLVVDRVREPLAVAGSVWVRVAVRFGEDAALLPDGGSFTPMVKVDELSVAKPPVTAVTVPDSLSSQSFEMVHVTVYPVPSGGGARGFPRNGVVVRGGHCGAEGHQADQAQRDGQDALQGEAHPAGDMPPGSHRPLTTNNSTGSCSTPDYRMIAVTRIGPKVT